MKKTSLIKISLFLIAIVANLNYLLFLLNPTHADNVGLYIMTVIADIIAVVIFLSTWMTALYFEACKSRYYHEIAELRSAGQGLLKQKVAVLITVVNEDLSIVRNTIQSACNLIGEKEVYVLDDGRKPETEQLARSMGVRYVTRLNNAFYKAGNLNNALAYHVPEPFFIVVDADFSLNEHFIERVLPLFADPRIAAVQTPQVYSNAETLFSRGCKHLQDVFYRYLQPGKHLLNSSFIVGTNVMCRKSAFVDIGGFAEMTHSEDVFTTLKLLEHDHQYKVAFLNEELAVGLSPTTLISFYTQQNRWARGGFTMLFKHSTLFNKRLHPEQRVQFFLSNFFYLSGISVLIYLLSPLIAILLNIKPFSDAYQQQWATAYIPYFCVNVIFGMGMLKKHRFSALTLGIFSFIPYLSALRSTVLSVRQFKWKITNTASKGLITKLLAPYIVYLCLAASIVYFLATGVLSYNPALVFYYAWLVLGIIIVSVFVVYSYLSRSTTTVPAFEHRRADVLSTAEVLSVHPPVQQPIPQVVPAPSPSQIKSPLRFRHFVEAAENHAQNGANIQ